MTPIRPIPVAHLQTIFQKWEDAPPGALLASGAYIAVSNDHGSYDRSCDPMIAVRAQGNTRALLVCISPKFLLLFDADIQRTVLSRPAVAMGPAIDIGATHQLAVADLAPSNNPGPFAAGDVVHDADSDRLFLIVDYPDYANRGLVLHGQDQWKITDVPNMGLVKIGTLSVVERKDSADRK